jgi:hypothetical protein
MSANHETDAVTTPLAAECASLRRNLGLAIRDRAGLTTEERAWFEQRGLQFEPDSSVVTWSPPAGAPNDLAAERAQLLCALHLLLGPSEPITEEEWREAWSSGRSFEEQLAELGVTGLGQPKPGANVE